MEPDLFLRSHGWTAHEAGGWIAIFAGIGGLGTFFGGYAADKFSVIMKDRRWYVWVPGLATLAMVPFQFTAYLASSLPMIVASFAIMTFLAAVFFGPSFTMTQALATFCACLGCHVVMLFVQTLKALALAVGRGRISDYLVRTMEALAPVRLVAVGLTTSGPAHYYCRGDRSGKT